MSSLPAWGLLNAIHRPSGDHRGLPGIGPPKEVSCLQSCPAASQIQSSQLAEAIRVEHDLLAIGRVLGFTLALSGGNQFRRWAVSLKVWASNSPNIGVE